jgi:hypothetical protein
MSGDGSFLTTTLTGGDTLLLPVLDGPGGGGELLGAFILPPPAILGGFVLPPAPCCCWGCWRCLARRFLNHTWNTEMQFCLDRQYFTCINCHIEVLF